MQLEHDDECSVGWAGEDCDECAAGYSGDMCDKTAGGGAVAAAAAASSASAAATTDDDNDECSVGWAGEDCDECAAGHSGDMCTFTSLAMKESRWSELRGLHDAAMSSRALCQGFDCYKTILRNDLSPFSEHGNVSRSSFEVAMKHDPFRTNGKGRMIHYQIIDGKLCVVGGFR